MLLFRSHWRFASEQAPHREARLLAFAEGGPNGGSGGGGSGKGSGKSGPDGPEPIDPLSNTEAFAAQGLNPDGTPIQRENVEENVATAKDTTRSQVADIMDDEGGEKVEVKDKRPEFASEVLGKAKDLKKRMDDLRDGMLALEAAKETYLNEMPEYRVQWEEYKSFLETEGRWSIMSWISDLERLKDWESGSIHPQNFRTDLGQKHGKSVRDSYVPGGTEKEHERVYWELGDVIARSPNEAEAIPDLRHPEGWSTINNSSRTEAIQSINKKINYRSYLDSYNTQINNWNDAINDSKLKEFIESVEKNKKENDPNKFKDVEKIGGLQQRMLGVGLEFYSINEIMDAFKEVKDAVTQSWDQRRKLKAARLAKQVGGVTEYIAKGSSKTLDANLESSNNEIRDNYKKYLESKSVNFKQLFDDGEEMDKNRDDPNRAKAIIEYAASKGWLYGLNDSKGSPWNEKLILGRWKLHEFLPDDEETDVNNYFGDLLSQNEKGAKNEAESAKAREQATDNANDFIKAINRELDSVNLWAAKGIMERAFERGLKGEISPWMATTFLRHLRNNTGNMRKYISSIMLNEMGVIAAYSPAFTLGYLKFDKEKLVPWAQTGKQDLAEAGKLGEVIAGIESEIYSADPNLSDEKVDRLVAEVLATKTVEVNGKFITIFSEQYSEYNNGSKQQGGTKIEKLDEDFFRNRSEVLMSDPIVLEALFEPTGDGRFKDPSRAAHFLTKALEVVPELQGLSKRTTDTNEQKKLLDAADLFRRNMREKLDKWILKNLSSSRAEPLALETLADQKTLAVLTLLQNDLLSFNNFKSAYLDDKGGIKFATLVLKQCIDPKANGNESLRKQAEAVFAEKKRREEEKDRKKKEAAAKTTPRPTPPSAGAEAAGAVPATSA